ncbi:pentatricopeptide repeat-containing protein At1g15510, chloroplastic [Curcuma longa]|uniref:pentatricopeptide repeat-containing protein At1g15510, chloroplastic n=1 Tax=Curcuma longa TaxID=136217 RepID=UPI003D9EEF90
MALSAHRPPNSLFFSDHNRLYRRRLLPAILSRSKPLCIPSGVAPNSHLAARSSLHASALSPADPDAEICRLCIRGDLDGALRLLAEAKGRSLDDDAYVALLRLCEWKLAVEQGFRVCSHISSTSSFAFSLSVRLGNALLSMLVRFGDLLAAWSVFGKMVERNVFSWNVMIGGYAKAGFLDEALDLYQGMLWAGAPPDLYTFPCILRSCAAIPDLIRGREVHAHVIRFGFGTEIDAMNALITMYAKCGNSAIAREVFDGMPRRDCISWNAMISGYFENEDCAEGLELFLTMRDLSLQPVPETMTSVISASDLLCDSKFGKEIHGYVIKMNFLADVSVHNSLIQMYSTFGDMGEAEKIFLRQESKDVISWTAMISGYEKNGLPEKALEMFERMRDNNVIPDEIAMSTVLSSCTSLGRLDIGTKVHKLAQDMGVMPSTMVGNALIDMYSKCRCVDKALEVFKCMPEKDVITWSSIISGLRINSRSFEALSLLRQMHVDVLPNSTTLVASLSACASVGALMCGKEIHAQALRRRLGSQGYLPNALLDLYAKCGRTKYARTQFNAHRSKDVVSWNIMLTGYAGKGHGDLAVSLFNQMIEAGVQPDEVTMVGVLCACSRSGMVSKGWDYFNIMKMKYSVTPNLKHYACIVDLLGRAGHLERAYQFIEDMTLEPDAAIWGALLNGCRIHHNLELGEFAARKIFELDDSSARYYELLCILYRDNGRWDQVAKVRKVMREKGLAVDPGCSWVEVKGSVHAFLSLDESHPQINQIYAVLNGLYERIGRAGMALPEDGSIDEMEASESDIFCGHSERLAVAFGLMNTTPGMPIWVTKNLYMCRSCHAILKSISKVVRREITIRDIEQFHHFKDGSCSCGEEGYWSGNVD